MDPMDSLFVMISGHKTFTLFSPDQVPSLNTISPTYGVSQDGFAFQYNSPAKLPSLDNSQMQGHELGKGHYHYSSLSDSAEVENGSIVELNGGDVLFIPAGWYYQVTTSAGPSVAVNYWWLPTYWRSTLALETDMKAALLDTLKRDKVSQQEGDEL
jgi:hypothetical protein